MLLLDLGIHVIRCDSAEEFNVFIRVKLCHFSFCCRFGTLILVVNNTNLEEIWVARKSPFSYRDHNS